MAFLTLRYLQSFLGRRYRDDGPDLRPAPEVVVLPVREGHAPSGKPPVRIFLGSEPAQFRAERIFVWSVEQVRDPARVYKIHLMKDLAGFRRKLWLTGFTNYRFAIPHFAGGAGKAIYNDTDQIYLADPALLFDLDMEGHGYRSIDDRDTSVMLIDCARMTSVWTLEEAQSRTRKALDTKAREIPGLWGPIDPGWNARDSEYSPGRTKVLHFTALQTQPWQPLPREYVYAENPVGQVWFDLEDSANAAGFTVFTADRPSRAYRELIAGPASVGERDRAPVGLTDSESRSLQTALERHDARDIVHVSLLGSPPPLVRRRSPVRRWSGPPPYDAQEDGADAVLCTDTLEFLPESDVPWILDFLFRRARKMAWVRVSDRPGGSPPRRPRGADWWLAQFESASTRRPGIHWIASVEAEDLFGFKHLQRFEGGARLGDAPSVWVLASNKTGHTSQAIGVAQALGWSYVIKPIRLGLSDILRLILFRELPREDADKQGFSPPWPDLVIASGWLPTRLARLVRERSGGRANLVLLGRKAGALSDPNDIGVSCLHFGLPPNRHRVDTVLPPCQVSPARLREAAARWPNLLGGAPAPRTVLLVGGGTKAHRLDADVAREMARSVSQAVEQSGGSLLVVTSRRTGAEATDGIKQGLGPADRLHEWRADAVENPFLGYLAQGDVFVVTGESESMLAEAVATGKPVYIYPVPAKPPGPWQRLSAWIAARGGARPENYRGTIRPQQGLEYLCARLIERGWVLPPRDLDALHRNVVRMGLARMFAGNVSPFQRPVCDPTREVGERVRALLGIRTVQASAPQPDRQLQAAEKVFAST